MKTYTRIEKLSACEEAQGICAICKNLDCIIEVDLALSESAAPIPCTSCNLFKIKGGKSQCVGHCLVDGMLTLQGIGA
jgi:hypothetical protein